MSNARVGGVLLTGRVTVPPSKSAAHRALICAALAEGRSRITPIIASEDMTATVHALQSMGAAIEWNDTEALIDGMKNAPSGNVQVDCHESGSTLRFLIPVAAALGINATFTGKGRLPQRPLQEYIKILPDHGVVCDYNGALPLTIKGKLRPGRYCLSADASSQYITGLMLALPLLERDSEIMLTTPLESKGYVDLTVSLLSEFGIKIYANGKGWRIPGNQRYRPHRYHVEGDWSQAAFFMASGAIGGEICLLGLNKHSVQGDREIIDLLRRFGADIRWEDEKLVCSGGRLRGITIDASQIPDLVPILAVTAAFAEGKTVIHAAARLRLKESDRLKSVAKGLGSLGVKVEETRDGLVITGGNPICPGVVDCFNDHRIVMAFAVAASHIDGECVIKGCEAVGKSYPDFFEEYIRLGGNANVIYDR